LSLQQNCCNKLGKLIIILEWNKKLVGFCRTSDFSFPNFVVSDWIVMLMYRLDSESKKTQSSHLCCVASFPIKVICQKYR